MTRWFPILAAAAALAACDDAGTPAPGAAESATVRVASGVAQTTSLGAPEDATADIAPDVQADVAPIDDATPDGTEDAGPEDTLGQPDALPDAQPDTSDTSEDADATDPGPALNLGFIGGPCASDADCDYAGGVCLTGPDHPNGLCTKDCAQFCPDQAGAITTFCVAPDDLAASAAEGLCTMRCMFGPAGSDTGCRDGYQCVPTERYGDPGTVVHSCLPGEGAGVVLSPCHEQLLAEGVSFELANNPMDSPDGYPEMTCDIEDPVRVEGLMHGVAYRYATTANDAKPLFASCPLAVSLSQQAQLLAEQGATDLLHYGIYNCRLISGSNPPKLSQHGLANALDVAGIRRADGSVAWVLDDWEKDTAFPVTDPGAFLKWFVETVFGQGLYTICLTPDYNAAHADHFHCDLTPGSSFLK